MNTLIFPQIPMRNLLVKCLAASLVAHAAALTWFYFHPMILQGPFQSLFGITAAQPISLENEEEISSLQKNHLLEKVFEHVVVLSPHFQQPYDMVELPRGIALAPNLEEDAVLATVDQNLFPFIPSNAFATSADLSFEDVEEWLIPAIFSAPGTGLPLASQLQIDAPSAVQELPFIAMPFAQETDLEEGIAIGGFPLNAAYESPLSLNLTPPSLSLDGLSMKTDFKALAMPISAEDLNLEKEQVRSTLFIPKANRAAPEQREVAVVSSLSEIEQYDFPALAMAAEWNDDFDVDVTFLPTPEGKGYIFSLSLTPNCDLADHSLKQNLYFLIDRSSSIQKHRFAVFKRAVLKALASMQHGDTFNILLMDKKITRFSAESCPVTLKNIHAAEAFLDKQEGGTLFTSSDVYTTIDRLLSSIPENEEVHTAILLSDGKSSLNAARKQSAINKWLQKNNGKMALYACAVGRDNDLLSLDLLSAVSGGKLLYSDTHASLPRKLAKLVLDLRDPVAKDLIITAIPQNPHSHIEFYAPNSSLSSLYTHQPYVIVGQIDDPCAFDLVIQGRHRDQWIAIKKNISFIEGKKGTHALENQWNAQHAHLCYTKFLEEGKATHLKEAKEILKKSRSEVAFE